MIRCDSCGVWSHELHVEEDPNEIDDWYCSYCQEKFQLVVKKRGIPKKNHETLKNIKKIIFFCRSEKKTKKPNNCCTSC